MTIQYTFQTEGDLLRVETVGIDESLQEVEEYGLAIIQAALASGCQRILCDERQLVYRLGTYNTYEAASFIAENAPRVVRVALVCHPACIEEAHFWETVATNRGLLARMFQDLEPARHWLDS